MTSHEDSVVRLGPERFQVGDEVVSLSGVAQDVLRGSQLIPTSDGGFVLSGYMAGTVLRGLRNRGVVDGEMRGQGLLNWCWGLTPLGESLAAFIRAEALS